MILKSTTSVSLLGFQYGGDRPSCRVLCTSIVWPAIGLFALYISGCATDTGIFGPSYTTVHVVIKRPETGDAPKHVIAAFESALVREADAIVIESTSKDHHLALKSRISRYKSYSGHLYWLIGREGRVDYKLDFELSRNREVLFSQLDIEKSVKRGNQLREEEWMKLFADAVRRFWGNAAKSLREHGYIVRTTSDYRLN